MPTAGVQSRDDDASINRILYCGLWMCYNTINKIILTIGAYFRLFSRDRIKTMSSMVHYYIVFLNEPTMMFLFLYFFIHIFFGIA